MKKFIFMLLLTSSSCLLAQNLDSLKVRVNEAPEGEQFEMILSYMRNLMKKDAQLAYNVSAYAIEYAEESGDSLLIAKALYAQGFTLRRLSDSNEAIQILLKSAGISKRNDFKEELKKSLNVLAIAYTYSGNYDKSLEYHFEALQLNEETKDLESISLTENNIGVAYFKLLDFENALLHYEKALEIKKKNGFGYDYEALVLNIALCYNQLKKYDIAEARILKVLKNCEGECSDDITMQAKYGLGISYLELERYSKSEECFLRSLELSKRLNDKHMISENYYSLSLLYNDTGQRDKSLLNLAEAEKVSIKLGYSQLLIDIYKQFALVYAHLSDSKKEAFYSKRYITIKDSIYSKKLIKNLADVQARYSERENKAKITHQQEILKLQEETVRRQQWIIALVGTSVLLVAIVAWLLYRSNSLKKQANKILECKVQERTYQLQESHSAIVRQSQERNKEVAKAYTELSASVATLKGVLDIGKREADNEEVKEYFDEAGKTVEQLTGITKRYLVK